MKLVAIESPLSGDFTRNMRYAQWCMLDCLQRGEAPYASHLLYTQCLDDGVESQRALGMKAGFEWATKAECRVVYVDLGISEGMHAGVRHGIEIHQNIHFRRLPDDMFDHFADGRSPGQTPGV